MYSPGILLSKKGIILTEDRILFPGPNKNKIILYLTKGLLYDALASLVTSGGNLINVLGVLDIERIANQTSIYKIIGAH